MTKFKLILLAAFVAATGFAQTRPASKVDAFPPGKAITSRNGEQRLVMPFGTATFTTPPGWHLVTGEPLVGPTFIIAPNDAPKEYWLHSGYIGASCILNKDARRAEGQEDIVNQASLQEQSFQDLRDPKQHLQPFTQAGGWPNDRVRLRTGREIAVWLQISNGFSLAGMIPEDGCYFSVALSAPRVEEFAKYRKAFDAVLTSYRFEPKK